MTYTPNLGEEFMSQTHSATYENGTLILDEPLEVSDGTKVDVLIVNNGSKKRRTPGEILARIAAMPSEGKTDPFSGRDHDEVLYGAKRQK